MSSQVHLGVFIGTQQQAQQEPASSTVHWLPCKAASSCDADVPRLFNATITNHPSSAAQGRDGSFSTSVHAPIQEACFRGRQLRGQHLSLPPGYTGYVTATGDPGLLQQGSGRAAAYYSQDEDEGGEDGSGAQRRHCKHWVVRHTFDGVTYWNHDTVPSRSDPSRRVFDWMEVAKQVHRPVSRQQVEEQLRKMQA